MGLAFSRKQVFMASKKSGTKLLIACNVYMNDEKIIGVLNNHAEVLLKTNIIRARKIS